MDKTVTILSSEESFGNNYGAALQGYSLFSTLQEWGYNPSFVRYRGGRFSNKYKKYSVFAVKRCLGFVYHRLFPSKTEMKHIRMQRPFRRDIQKREASFKEFSEENMSFWNKKRVDWWGLKDNYPVSDFYICGSDQIWNPYFKGKQNDPGYFLAFAPKGAKKIAYAPSFGCDDLPDKAKTNLEELLSDFTAISVREYSGVDIVKKYAKREAQWVLDPTMLRTSEQWREFARLPEGIPDKYILCYRFAQSEHTKQYIEKISEKLNLPVISLSLSNVSLEDDFEKVFHAGPKEFVGLIKNAALVCTDSFHATVFSVLMKTPLCVFLRENYDSGNSMNTRVYSLLKMLSLEHLIISPDASLQDMGAALKENFLEAHTILAQKREESIAFLKGALNKE